MAALPEPGPSPAGSALRRARRSRRRNLHVLPRAAVGGRAVPDEALHARVGGGHRVRVRVRERVQRARVLRRTGSRSSRRPATSCTRRSASRFSEGSSAPWQMRIFALIFAAASAEAGIRPPWKLTIPRAAPRVGERLDGGAAEAVADRRDPRGIDEARSEQLVEARPGRAPP